MQPRVFLLIVAIALWVSLILAGWGLLYDTRCLIFAASCFFFRIKQSFFVTVAIFSLDQAGQRFSIIPEIPFWQSATFAITAALLFQKYQVSESK